MSSTTFVDNETVVPAAWLNDVNRRIYTDDVYVTDPTFGYSGSGTISATVFQAAINAVQGTKARLIIPGNTTIALGATGVTVTGALTLIGAGLSRTFITWTDTTMFAMTVTTPNAVHIEGVYFSGPSGGTAGGAISLSGSGGVSNSFSKIKDCQFVYGYRTIYAPDAYAWEITGSYFSGYIFNGVYVGNSTTADAGDSTIHGNIFANGGASSTAIYQVSSGGLRIENNKINGGSKGYWLDMANGAVTSILIIEGNSIENQTHSGIRFLNTSGAGWGMSQVSITGNQLAYQPTPIMLEETSTFCTGVSIVGNIIYAATGATTTSMITVTALDRVNISHNILAGSGSTGVGITIGANADDCAVRDNVITGCTTNVSDAGASGTVASAATITLSTAKDVFTITGVTNISTISASSAVEGRVVTLIFQGVLTVNDGSNLKLNGPFLTSADDTLTLACDGTNWYEVARSAN